MQKPNWFIFGLVILALNAAVTLVLIDLYRSSDRASDSIFSKQSPLHKSITGLNESRRNAITDAVHEVEPAVVSVNVIKTEIVNRGNFFGWPFGDFLGGPMKQQVKGIGSGVIYTPDGYIITNGHVVNGATQIKVVLPDARQFDANIVGLDAANDVAVIKIQGGHLPYAKLGTSSDLVIGEWAIALGNPYGFLMNDTKPSVSVGVISAVKRNFGARQDGIVYKDMIQTDAAVNQGNSGGPLININGEVIGINTFIVSETGGSIGIGFALPVDRVKGIANELMKYHKLRKVSFGIKVEELSPELADYLKLKQESGVLVIGLDTKSPAYKAGLRHNDIITKVNGNSIMNGADIKLAVTDIQVGNKVSFEFLRDGRKQSISFVAQE